MINTARANKTNQTYACTAPYTMKQKHDSLSDMWDEWNVNGEFSDPDGGVVGRMEKYGKKWRSYPQVDVGSTQYSCTARIIAMLKLTAEENNWSIHMTIKSMQGMHDACKKSTTLFLRECQDRGFIPKRKSQEARMITKNDNRQHQPATTNNDNNRQ